MGNGGLFTKDNPKGISLISLQSAVYAVIKVTAASSMNQCPLVAGWGKVTGGSNLEGRVAQARKFDKDNAPAPGTSGELFRLGNFIYCGWSDAKTRKLQMETDKALCQHVAKFRFDVATTPSLGRTTKEQVRRQLAIGCACHIGLHLCDMKEGEAVPHLFCVIISLVY